MENQPQKQQLTKKERKELKRQQKVLSLEQISQRKKTKRLISWLIIAIFVVAIIFGIAQTSKKSQVSTNFDPNLDWVKGNKEAKIALIEYSDFQCPACKAYQSMLNQLYNEFQNEISITYRHFPLKSIHKNATIAAQAAEAAGIQNKFWEMHDVLFDKQAEWSEQNNPSVEFVKYAVSLGLDEQRFKSDLNSAAVKKKVGNSYQASIALKINSTPTFYINGEKIQNPSNYEEFKSIIQSIINKK